MQVVPISRRIAPLAAFACFAHELALGLARIALPDLVDQLIAALRDAGGRTPLGLQAEWVVMAAWLVQLRSRLLLPAEANASDAASQEAAQLHRGLARLDAVQAAARWLDEQPRLGRDVFARGRPELTGIGTTALHQMDVVEFLWASLALFDDDLPPPDTAPRYRPAWLDLHAIPDARSRILRRMADGPAPCRLDHLLPDPSGPGTPHDTGLRGRSRWTSTFTASLELAKQGDVVLEQKKSFSPIQVGNVDRMQATAQADGDA